MPKKTSKKRGKARAKMQGQKKAPKGRRSTRRKISRRSGTVKRQQSSSRARDTEKVREEMLRYHDIGQPLESTVASPTTLPE